MQCSIDKFSTECKKFGLTTSTKETKELHQPAPRRPYGQWSLAAHCPRSSPLMTKWVAELREKVQHLANYTPMSQTAEALVYWFSWRCTEQLFSLWSCTLVNPGQHTNVMLGSWTTYTQTAWENCDLSYQHQLAGQDPRHQDACLNRPIQYLHHPDAV